MNRNRWKGSQSVEVTLLADRLPWITLAAYRCGEVADANDLVILVEKRFRKGLQVQPFKTGSP